MELTYIFMIVSAVGLVGIVYNLIAMRRDQRKAGMTE